MKLSALAMVLATVLPQLTQTPQPTPAGNNNNLPQLVLTFVLGERQASKGGSFAPAATKALADLKDFLPYQSYRPLDTVFMIGFGTPSHDVQGPDGKTYGLSLRGRASATVADLHLQLRDPKPATPEMSPWLIDTSFKLQVGETIVVGTSRLDGERALLVLVTWVK